MPLDSRSFLRRLLWLPRRSEKEAELREELQFHLQEEAEQSQVHGSTEDQARCAARRELGNLALVEENTRAAWGCSTRRRRGGGARACTAGNAISGKAGSRRNGRRAAHARLARAGLLRRHWNSFGASLRACASGSMLDDGFTLWLPTQLCARCDRRVSDSGSGGILRVPRSLAPGLACRSGGCPEERIAGQ